MFCPNCGKDCGDANFCSACGQKLPLNAEKGTHDPHLGNTKPKGNSCPFCGAHLNGDGSNPNRRKYFFVPYGAYEGAHGYIKLREDELVIKNRFTNERTIPYEKIVDVRYYEVKGLHWPRLTIRWEQNKDLPIPEEYWSAFSDETTVFHYVRDKAIFFQIFHAIRDIAEMNKSNSE